MMRIGHGYDVHAFGEGDHITLGGVRVPHTHGLVAHSDGDVLIHALCDALLGAAALGDLGRHFPDTEKAYRNADSRLFLRQVARQLAEQGYRIVNVDNTVIAQTPKLQTHIDAMRHNLAEDLDIRIQQVSVKATSTERLGFVGREEGIEAHSVALVQFEES